mmetsp:Transcript_539/g.735  ORF Transcript_539/g.735 Transcript_539/m.735 type:complete len:205 (-) Transcript_539:25-639(-)
MHCNGHATQRVTSAIIHCPLPSVMCRIGAAEDGGTCHPTFKLRQFAKAQLVKFDKFLDGLRRFHFASPLLENAWQRNHLVCAIAGGRVGGPTCFVPFAPVLRCQSRSLQDIEAGIIPVQRFRQAVSARCATSRFLRCGCKDRSCSTRHIHLLNLLLRSLKTLQPSSSLLAFFLSFPIRADACSAPQAHKPATCARQSGDQGNTR